MLQKNLQKAVGLKRPKVPIEGGMDTNSTEPTQ